MTMHLCLVGGRLAIPALAAVLLGSIVPPEAPSWMAMFESSPALPGWEIAYASSSPLETHGAPSTGTPDWETVGDSWPRIRRMERNLDLLVDELDEIHESIGSDLGELWQQDSVLARCLLRQRIAHNELVRLATVVLAGHALWMLVFTVLNVMVMLKGSRKTGKLRTPNYEIGPGTNAGGMSPSLDAVIRPPSREEGEQEKPGNSIVLEASHDDWRKLNDDELLELARPRFPSLYRRYQSDAQRLRKLSDEVKRWCWMYELYKTYRA